MGHNGIGAGGNGYANLSQFIQPVNLFIPFLVNRLIKSAHLFQQSPAAEKVCHNGSGEGGCGEFILNTAYNCLRSLMEKRQSRGEPKGLRQTIVVGEGNKQTTGSAPPPVESRCQTNLLRLTNVPGH